MICLHPPIFATKREVDGLRVSTGEPPAEQLLLEHKPGGPFSLGGGQAVPFRPPLGIRLGYVAAVLVQHDDCLEDNFKKGMGTYTFQLSLGLLCNPRQEAGLEADHILAKDGVEVELPEGVAAGRSALAVGARIVAPSACSAAGTADASLRVGACQAAPIGSVVVKRR
jgi:hypothetical protein